jgi:hypothetical protein
MKYFLDTEFIEGFHKPMFGKKRHFIDLISIGIVCEDGRSYYAISNEYDFYKADAWVQTNVIYPMYHDTVHGDGRNHFNRHNFHKHYGKSNNRITEELMMFFYPEQSKEFKGAEGEFLSRGKQYGWGGDQPEFYGYYSDYDWVLFCSLFGLMINLPKGFPMYCIDLKQIFDEKFPAPIQKEIKESGNYPKQINEHNALADAKWNFELYKFLTK